MILTVTIVTNYKFVIISDICFGSIYGIHFLTFYSGILFGVLFWHSLAAFHLASILASHLASYCGILSDILFYILLWHPLWHLFWHSIWRSIWHSILAFYLASILTFYSAILSGIVSGIYSWVHSGIILSGISADILSEREISVRSQWDLSGQEGT